MQQRQPRLGDVVDDYCPRERRVTNHAVVAMVGDEVKQTRCTTCDAEHDYKHAKVPPQRKKKDVPGALYQQVLDGIPRVVPTPDPSLEDEAETGSSVQADAEAESEGDSAALAADAAPSGEHEGPVHRRLIRATLPTVAGRRGAAEARARVHDARPGPWAARQAEERLSRRRHAPRGWPVRTGTGARARATTVAASGTGVPAATVPGIAPASQVRAVVAPADSVRVAATRSVRGSATPRSTVPIFRCD